jgi:FtsH-binding integral membrane protein
MFLTTWIGTGLVGITLFVLLFIVGFYQSVKRRSWLLFVFMLVSLLTMFFEDSLETQAGVSFFAFYYSFLLLGNGRIIQWSLKNN